MHPDIYLILIGSEFNHPHHSGKLPVIQYGATGETTSELVQHHKLNQTQFDITKVCNESLKQQIMARFQNDYAEAVANANFGLAYTKTLKLINHLYNSYVTITPSKMEHTTNTMVIPYDTSKPITNCFVQI